MPLAQAAHPRQAVVTATVLAAAAAVAGRPPREAGLVAATALVGQALIGWGDDLADQDADRRRRPGKPLASSRLDPGTLWFALACGVLVLVPLAVANGPRSGAAYLASVAIALVGDRLLHATPLSFLPWTASFALYPVFLAHGGWNGAGADTPPTATMVVLAALLGMGVHLLLALPGLVADHEEGEHSLPLVLALRTGTPRLLLVAGLVTAVVVVAILLTGRAVGLT